MTVTGRVDIVGGGAGALDLLDALELMGGAGMDLETR